MVTCGSSQNPYDHSVAVLYGVSPPPPLVLQQPGDFHGLPSAAIGLPLVFQQPSHSYYLPLAATGLDHYNVAVTTNTSFYMKSTFHINGNLIPKSLLLHTNTGSASLDLETKSNIRCICKRIDALFYAPQSLELIIVLPPRSTNLISIPTLSDSLIFDSFFLLFFFLSSI